MAIIVQLWDSPLGELAIERAAEEANLRDEPLVLTASVTMPRNERDVGDYRQRREEIQASLERKARELGEQGITCRVAIPSSPVSAAEAILEAADEHDASLIVIGIRRRSSVGKLVLGSVAQDVILAAECDVLGVKLPVGQDDRD